MNPTAAVPVPAGRRWPWLAAAAALVGLKLWLVSAQRIFAIGFANYDDALFVRLAGFIRDGQWLGPYDHFTLAKGPMYPVFIAACDLLHVPLFTAQQLLYAAACALLVRALRPLVPGRAVRLALFAVLLFNPVTYDTVIHARVLRQNIIHSLVLLVLAGLVALAARPAAPVRRLLPWALLVGGALPAFWLTREEGVWLLPAAVLPWLAAAWVQGRHPVPGRAARLACVALPGFLWAAALALVAAVNLRCYGVFTTCEFNHPALRDAYGALTRVEPAPWRPWLPVTREMRERLYPLSPAFASLRGELEGPAGEAWAGVTEFLTGRPPAEREIASVWFLWALRRAVWDTGQARDGRAAMDFYARLAREVNEACDRGLIAAGPRRSGYLPPLRPEHWQRFPASLAAALREVVTFAHLDARPREPSLGSPEELAMFARVTRGRLVPPAGDPATPFAPDGWDRRRMEALAAIQRGYALASPWFGAAGGLAWLAAAVLAVRRRRGGLPLLLGVGLLGSVVALAGIVALLDVMTFPAIETGYFTGAYALWLLFPFTAGLALATARVPAAGGTQIGVDSAGPAR